MRKTLLLLLAFLIILLVSGCLDLLNPGKSTPQSPEPSGPETAPAGEGQPRLGTIVYKDGSYIGELREGLPHGYGKWTEQGGASYEGQWVNGKKHGQGTLIYQDGGIYEGEWKGDKRHGYGVATHPEGARYEGEWIAGERQGYGVGYYADGSVYEGNWYQSKRHGQGILTRADGSTFEGEWLHGDPLNNTSAGGSQETITEVSDGNYLLALVTKEVSLKSTYAPTDLIRIPEYMNPPRELYLREAAFQNLEQLWQAALTDGVQLQVISAYRSYSYQNTLFNNYAQNYGEQEANRFSARPGQSEHQLGTTVDFGGTSVNLKAAYGETPQGLWLSENAHRFGFALSYPENSEHITGYIYEPWHFRYIGVESALEWKKSGLVLSEFLKTKPQW